MYEVIYYKQDNTFHYVAHVYPDKCNEVLASEKETLLIYLN
jgi:hypothetical protein